MAVPDYGVLATALTRAKERSGATDDTLVTEYLNLTAGTDADDNTVYRPYLTAAVLIEQARTGVIEAEGAKLRAYGTRDPRALRRLQASVDETLDLTVPPEWVAWAGVSWGI
jgi:hypothetical protein